MVFTKFVQIKAPGLKLALPGAYIQVSDFRAIMALLLKVLKQSHLLYDEPCK
jgi:hypothetical protein